MSDAGWLENTRHGVWLREYQARRAKEAERAAAKEASKEAAKKEKAS